MAPQAVTHTSSTELLTRVPLFAELEAADLQALAEMFIIESGTVKLCLTSPDGKEFLIDMLGPYQLLR